MFVNALSVLSDFTSITKFPFRLTQFFQSLVSSFTVSVRCDASSCFFSCENIRLSLCRPVSCVTRLCLWPRDDCVCASCNIQLLLELTLASDFTDFDAKSRCEQVWTRGAESLLVLLPAKDVTDFGEDSQKTSSSASVCSSLCSITNPNRAAALVCFHSV